MNSRNGGKCPGEWIAAVVALSCGVLHAAPADPRLVVELERVYSAWKSAMTGRDLDRWAQHTARSRQMAVRNTIVSQKREWPRSLFSLAMMPPEVEGLRLAGSEFVGDQARLIYHGRVDFRVGDSRTPPDGALVLDFAREPGGWKFFGQRYHNLQNDAELSRKVARGDVSELNGPASALTGRAPPVPAACPMPDYAGQMRITAHGYSVTVKLGGHHGDTVVGRSSNEIIIGGLKRGANPLTVTVQPLNQVGVDEPSLEISVYALTPHLKTPAVRVFHFQPNNPVAERYDLTVNVGAATLRQGNEIDLIPSE
jgi:hypothetical protein